MARKGWDALSPNYRKRLANKGISKSDYESGASIKAARGHEKTPERPRGFDRSKFPEYVSRRESLMRKVAERKRQLWGDQPRWDDQRAEQHIRQKPITNRLLQWFLNADESELIDAIREDSETFYFVGYH